MHFDQRNGWSIFEFDARPLAAMTDSGPSAVHGQKRAMFIELVDQRDESLALVLRSGAMKRGTPSSAKMEVRGHVR